MSARRTTLWGVGGAVLVVAAAAALLLREPQPEALVPAPGNVVFAGPELERSKPDQVALRLRNFMSACFNGDMATAERYVDPGSHLSVTSACAAATVGLAPAGVTRYQFERVAADQEGRATVYVTSWQPNRAGERFTFFMSKVGGQWYFSVP